MNNLNISSYIGKNDGDTLSAAQWNSLFTEIQSKINEIIPKTSESCFYVNGVVTSPTNGVITLSSGQSYTLEGTLNGQIVVDAQIQPTANTILHLNGVNIITNANSGIKYLTPTINTGFMDLVINLDKDTINSITCNTVAAIAENQEACLYSMNNMVVQGVGYLTCVNKGGHGIKASELRITGPHIYVEASHDAIHGSGTLDLDCGTFFINKANDAFGTGDAGTINIFGGTYYAYNIIENVFDGKIACNIFNKNHTISGTNVPAASQYINKVLVYSNPVLYFGETSVGTIVQYATVTKNDDGTWTGEGTPVTKDVNGVYQVTAQYLELKGYIDGPITTASNVIDVDVRLERAYVVNTTISQPTIYYSASSGKLKLYSAQNSINMMVNKATGDITLYDFDVAKSENNLTIEVKNGSHLFIESTQDDGLDSGDVKINDSKGVLICTNCGGRGIKGSCIIIGPNASTTKSVITSYYTDPTDTENYKTLEGAVVSINNCILHELSIGIVPLSGTDLTYKNFGYSDVYCRNGKYSKGVFGTYSPCLIGVFICGSIASCIGMDYNKSNNIYYNTIVTSGSTGLTGDCGKTYEQFQYIPYHKTAVIK